MLSCPKSNGCNNCGFRDGELCVWMVDMGVAHKSIQLHDFAHGEKGIFESQKVRCGNEILKRRDDWSAVFWSEKILRSEEKLTRFCARHVSLRRVDVHFISVKIGVIRLANAEIESKSLMRKNPHTVGHETKPMQRRLPIEEDVISIN